MAKYDRNTVVSQYEEKRRSSPKWEAEQKAVHSLLWDVGKGAHVLDIPVGTGRFANIYEQIGVHRMVGADTSPLMLKRARTRGFDTQRADIRELPFCDCEFGISVCVRLAGWLSPEDLQKAISELARVSENYIVFGVRTVESGTRRKGKAYWLHSQKGLEQAFEEAGFLQDQKALVDDNGYSIYRMARS